MVLGSTSMVVLRIASTLPVCENTQSPILMLMVRKISSIKWHILQGKSYYIRQKSRLNKLTIHANAPDDEIVRKQRSSTLQGWAECELYGYSAGACKGASPFAHSIEDCCSCHPGYCSAGVLIEFLSHEHASWVHRTSCLQDSGFHRVHGPGSCLVHCSSWARYSFLEGFCF